MGIGRLLGRRRRQPASEPEHPLVALAKALDRGDAPAEFLSFGLGCMYFGADPETFQGSASQHVSDIRAALSTLPMVSNVEIRDPELGWFETSLPYGLEVGGQPFPAIRRLRIDFRLTLTPDALAQVDRWDLAQETAIIDVSIRQGTAVPVAFIVPHTERDRPARAVTLTWRALREFLPDDASVIFDMRGPSPAHLEAFLVPARYPKVGGLSRTFEYQRIGTPWGYGLGVFAYDPRAYDDEVETSESLFEELEVPAGLYYELQGAERRLNFQWEDLEEGRRELVELETSRGVRAFIRRRFRTSARLRDLAVSLTEFEADVEAEATSYAEWRRGLEEIPGTPFLAAEIDEELRTAFRFPTARISRPLALFETRRLATAQNLAALSAAILAAFIGATSALWVAGSDSSGPPLQTTVTVATTVETSPTRTTTPRPAPPKATTRTGSTGSVTLTGREPGRRDLP